MDTVGVHRYPLDRNIDTRVDPTATSKSSRALGWIIVRVGLRDGAKIVSVESPLTLRSTSDTDLLCEIREFNGASLLWRCIVPRLERNAKEGKGKSDLIPVPADIVPFLHERSHSFSVFAIRNSTGMKYHCDELTMLDDSHRNRIRTPAPFSPQSYGRGLLGEENISLRTFDPIFGASSVFDNAFTKDSERGKTQPS